MTTGVTRHESISVAMATSLAKPPSASSLPEAESVTALAGLVGRFVAGAGGFGFGRERAAALVVHGGDDRAGAEQVFQRRAQAAVSPALACCDDGDRLAGGAEGNA